VLRGVGSNDPTLAVLRSFGIGLAIGGVAGIIWILFLKLLRSKEHAYPVTLSALLILYVVIDHLGGSAALGILTVAVLLGNAPSLSKTFGLAEAMELDAAVRGFHRQVAFMIKSFFFVFIGAMLGPPWSSIAFGLLLGVALLLARVPSVWLATLGGGFSAAERQMVSVALPRGMAAGVLATLPHAKGIEGTAALPVIVFAAVFTTILTFAVGFPLVRRRMPTAPTGVDVPLPAGAARPSIVPLATAPTYSPVADPAETDALSKDEGIGPKANL
jgi:NhaP-type Na+/H+ or K+/H+ antiporter